MRIAAVLSLLATLGCASVPAPGPVTIPPRAPSCFELAPEYLLACPSPAEAPPTRDELSAAMSSAQRAGHPASARDDLAPRTWTPEEAHVAHLLHAMRCTMPADDPERPTIVYRLARVYYDANQFSPAVVFFDEVAMDPGAADLAMFGAELALDALTVRVWRTDGAERDDCLARFAPMVARYRERLCTPTRLDEDACTLLENVARAGPTLAPPTTRRRRGGRQ